MKSHTNLHWFIYGFLLLFMSSCARQSSPTGGPKDTIPPTLVRAIPPNESINFNGKNIELEFSEAIILNTPKEQLIVTPTINKEYKIINRKNTVLIELAEPLRDSTTYTFNFRESVGDITEKNPVRNLTLAYSTGTYLDSLSIEGKIHDLISGKAIKDATVALHPENDTFNILEHPAIYFTKTDDKGQFKISHLKPDNYFVYAFEDKNRNLIVNSRTESYGFKSEYQYLLDNIKEVSLGLIRLDAGPLNLTSARPYNTYFNIRTSKNLRAFALSAPDSTDLTYSFGENQANIRLYKTTNRDSLQVRLIATDSIENTIDTTLYAKFLTREVTPEKFDMQVVTTSLLAHTGEFSATVQFTKPLKEVNFDSLYFEIDSLTRVNFSPDDLHWDIPSKKLTITKKLDRTNFQNPEENTQSRRGMRPQRPTVQTPTEKEPDTPKKLINEFSLGTGAFISIEQDSSKRIQQAVKPLQQQELSIINIQIRTTEPAYFVQLLDNSYKVMRQVKGQPNIRFQDVVPGEYQIRLIIDRNNNGRWDPGNYFRETEPEPIVYYRAPDGTTAIKGVKANWEIGIDGEMFITY